MAREPSPAEKRSIPRPAERPEQTELEQFPCGFDQDDITGEPTPCGGECPAVEFNRPCPFLIVYRKALAYKRCARLLEEFYRCALSLAIGLGASRFMKRALRYRNRMDELLRQAGLL